MKQEKSIADLEEKIHRIQKSTRTSLRQLHPLHNHLRMKYGWYYNWHLNPFVHVIHASVLGLYLIGLGIFGYTFFQNPTVIKAASEKSWATADSWSQWQFEGLQVSGDQLSLAADAPEGSALLVFTPQSDEVVDWLSSDTISSGISRTQYSTDNILWNNKIEDLADSKTLYAKVILSKDEITTSSLSSFGISYSRYPIKPYDLTFVIKKGFLADKYLLSAGTFSDLDADSHAASQWQVTNTSGDYANLLFDSGSVTNGDLNTYTLDKRLSEGQYFFRVRYQDSVGAWSLWSDECAFAIEKTGHKVSGITNGTAQQIINPNEIVSSRTETTKTIDNKDDTKTLEAYTGIIHYREDYAKTTSQWLDINPDHSIDKPEYVMYDQMPSTVKVFKDKIGYEIESRVTGDKYTVVLNDLDGAPVLSKSKGSGSKVAWADINTPAEKQQKESRNALAKWITPDAYAVTTALDDGNLKFEFEISEYGVRLWKTIKGEDAPKNFKWDITKSDGTKVANVDDLKFRDNPEAFEVVNGADARDKQIEIEAKKIDGSMNSSFVWQETAPKSDIKIDTDVIFYPDADPENWTVDGTLQKYGATWSDARDAATADIVQDTPASFYGAHVMNYDNSTYSVARSFFSFEVGYLAGKTITGGTFSAWGESKTTSNSADPDLGLYYSSPFTSNSALTADDYAKAGNTPLSSAVDYAGFSTTGYNNFVLNPAGIGYIQSRVDSGGYPAYLAMKTVSYDSMNSAPSTVPGQPHGGDLNVYFADQAGSGQDPKLTLTYGTGGKTSMADVWVPAQDFNNVRKFDASDGAIQGTVGTQNTPSGVAVDGNGFVWVANSVTGSVSKINSVNMLNVGNFVTGANAYGVAIDANGDVWVANTDVDTVSKMNGSTGAKIGDYPTGADPDGIAIDGSGYAWISNYTDGTVSKIQVSDGSNIGNYTVGNGPMGVAVDENGFVWVANNNDGTVSKINGSTGAKVADYPTGDGAAGVAADGEGFVWVTNNQPNTVSKINITNGAEANEYATGGWPNAVSADGNGYVWIVNVDDSTVSKMNMSTGIIAGSYATSSYSNYGFGDMTGFAFQRFTLPQAPSGIIISGTAYTSDSKSATVTDGTTVGLSINGGVKSTVTTTTGGVFSFTDKTVAANDTLTLYLSGGTYTGNLVTQAVDGTTDITGLELYANDVVISHQTAGPMTNTLLATANDCSDCGTDIKFTDSSGAVTFDPAYKVWIATGKTYTPGATATLGSINIAGTFAPGANTINVSRNWVNTGTFTKGTSTVNFNSSSAATVASNSQDFYNVTVAGAAGSAISTPNIWVSNYSSNNVSKINATTGAKVGDYATGLYSNGVAVDANGFVWVANPGSNTVSKINATTGAKVGDYATGSTPCGVAVDANGFIWVTNLNNNTVSKINATTGAKVADYATGLSPIGVAVDANGFVWVTNSHFVGNTVSKINATTGDKVGDYATGSSPQGVAVDANGFIWVANQVSNNVSKINATTGAKVGDYATGSNPKGVAVDANGFIWVANDGDGTVSKINATTGSKVADYATGLYSNGVSVDANGFVWVANPGSNTVSKINATTGAKVGDYATGSTPQGFGDMTGFALQKFVLGGGASGSLTTSSAITATNNLTVSSGTLDASGYNVSAGNVIQSGGTFTAPTSGKTFTVNGGWNHSAGTFTPGTGTVTFAGDALIQGDTTFNNFTHATPNKTITVTASTTQTISGALSINGTDASNKITLVSSSPSTRWNIAPNGTKSVSWVTVSDSTSSVAINATNSTEGTPSSTTNWLAAFAPTVTTSAATDVATNSFTGNGNVTSDGGATVSARGFYYASDYSVGHDCSGAADLNQATAGSGVGVFSATVSVPGAMYYCYRSYATNSAGTGFGAWTSLQTPSATHTLTYSAGANGSIVGTTPQTVNHGADGTQVTATPAANYHWVSWSDAYPTAARTDLNVTGDITVSATFAIDTYTLTYSAGANGSIVGTTPQTVNHGADGSEVVATPAPNYHWVSWSDGYPTAVRTDTNVIANKSVTASFALNTYTLTYSAGANGSITGTTPQTVNHGADGSQVTATPAANYHWVSWSDAYPTAVRTDLAVTGNITVTASFAIDTYTLTYSAGANGSIVGTTPQTVNHGADGSQVTATPAANYHWVSWSDAYPTAVRTDTNVIANKSVTASFALNTYTLTYSAGANGSITGTTPQTVNHGADGSQVTATPAANYHWVSWSDAYPTAVRTDLAVTGNITVTASFAIDTYTLTYSAGANGSITGLSPQTVGYGSNGSQVIATPAPNYHFVSWSDAYLTAARTDLSVTGNITVTATFAIDTYTITSSASTGGSISPLGATVLNAGSNQDYIITVVPGYYIANIIVDGIPQSGALASPYSFTNLLANHTISVIFTADGSCVWDGGITGITDDNWSTVDNWSGNALPTSACDVVFNSTSHKASTLNSGFTNHIKSLTLNGYTSTITLAKDLNDDGNLTMSSGTIKANNYTLNIGGSWTNTAGTFIKDTSTVNFNGSSAATVASNSNDFYNVTFAGVSSLTTPNVWVANYNSNSVSKIDSSTGAKIDDYVSDNYPYGSAVDASGFVWVTNMNKDTVSKIDVATGDKIADYATGSLPKGVAIDANGFVWVTNYSSSTVSKINPSTGAKTSYATGVAPTGVAIDPNGFVWVTSTNVIGSVSKINASTGVKVADYRISTSPTSIAADGSGFIWVVNSNNTVSKIDSSTGAVAAEFATGLSPAGVAVAADGFVWVTNSGVNTISKINPTTGSRTDYATGLSPAGVSVAADGYIWAANTMDDTISKINPSSGAKTDYAVGDSPYSYGDMTGFALRKFVLGGNNDLSTGSVYSLSSNLVASSTLTINSGVVNSAANTMSTATFVQTGGYFTAPSTTLTVTQDFQRTGGVYVHGSGTVNLAGTSGSTQVISGSTVFNNLLATASVARTIQFAASSTQTVLGRWTATGTTDQLLILALKTGDSGSWNIYPALWTVDYVEVSSSTNLASALIAPLHYSAASPTASNTNWFSLAITSHIITSSVVGSNGTISPNGSSSVVDGGTQIYTISPAAGYHISDIKIDGVSLTGTLASTYTFTNVIINHTISAAFAANDVCVWDGGGSDNNWSTASNWSSDILPVSTCDVVLNSTSVNNSVIDSGFTNSIRSFTTNTGYTGIVYLNSDLTVAENFSLNSGSFYAGSKKINVAGSLFIAASSATVFDKGTGIINFNPSLTGKTITTNGQRLGNLTFNGVDKDLTGLLIIINNNVALIRKGTLSAGWTLQDNLLATSIVANAGTLVDAGKSVTVAGNIYIANKIGILASSGLWTQSANGTISNANYRNSFGSLVIAGEGVTTTMVGSVFVGLNDGSVGALTIGPGTIYGNGYSVQDYMRQNNNITINNPIVKSKLSYLVIYPLGNFTQKAISLPKNFTSVVRVQKQASGKLTATGDFDFSNSNFTINNDGVSSNTGYVDMGPYTLSCNNLTIGSDFGSARFPAYYQIAGGLKLTTGAINVSGNLLAGNALNFGNRIYLGSGTLTVSGNLDMRYIILTESTSTVDLIGTGTLATSPSNYFYNIKLAHPEKTTTITSEIFRVRNIMYTYGGGSLVNGWAYLYKSDGDPFIDTGATLTNNTFLYMSTGNIDVSGHNMKRVYYRAYTNNVTYTLTSDLVTETIVIYSNTAGKVGTLNTSTKNIQTNSISLGSTSSPENMTYSGALDFGTGSHVVGASIRRNANSPSLDSSINFNKSTVRIGGDIDFSNLIVTPGVSTVILNGAANSTQTFIGNNTFNNLTFENTGARTVRFAGDTTQTISGTWTAKGSQSNLLSLALKSGDSGSWSIRPAAWDVRYVNVKNSINLGINRIDPANSVDGGGNTNWFAPKVVPVTPITAIVDIGGTITKGISAVTKSVGDIVGGLVQGVVDIITQSGLANVIQEVYENIVQAIAVTSTAIRNALSVIGLTPEAASSIATATVAVSTALVASVLAPAMATGSLANIGEIFHSVWQPIANLVTGKRRKNWGRIIEEGTGAPIMNTKINLVKVYRESPTVMYESQKVVASTFTDKLGKYGFIAEPGKYKLEIVKTDYSVVDTNSFLDFYHTNTLFEVKDYKQGLVIKDVALSSASKNLEKMFKLTHFTQILSKILSYASFVFLIFGTITIIPVVTQKLSLMNIVIVAAYVFLWGLNGKNLMKKSPWGTVVDKSKNTNLPLVLVRVIDKKTGQLVRTTVSNESGRFSTFIDKGNYEIRALKSGYVLDNPINYTVGKERSTLSKKIEMRPE